MKNRQHGFTLVELLVVIAIIGLLSTIGVVSLNSARAKARDAKRLSDVRQITSVLELYYNGKQQYPQSPATGRQMSDTDASGCVSEQNGVVGAPATGDVAAAACGAVPLLSVMPRPNVGTGTQEYRYVGYETAPAPAPSGTAVAAQLCDGSAGNTDCQAYGIEFTLETSVSGINAGLNCLTSSGFLTQPATSVGCTKTG